jgi:hypothetical protein
VEGKQLSMGKATAGFAGGLLLLLIGCGESTPESRQARECKSSSTMPAIMSKHFVEKHLRAPSTAKFPGKAEQQAYIDTCTWHVRSYVDAQNGFGGTVRTPYLIKMRYDPQTDRWTGFELQM